MYHLQFYFFLPNLIPFFYARSHNGKMLQAMKYVINCREFTRGVLGVFSLRTCITLSTNNVQFPVYFIVPLSDRLRHGYS